MDKQTVTGIVYKRCNSSLLCFLKQARWWQYCTWIALGCGV